MSRLDSLLDEWKDLMGLIRFVDTPLGGVPLEIRQKWVGIEVPCLYRGMSENSIEISTGKLLPAYLGYTTFQGQAIRALRLKSPSAANYWNHIGFPEDEFALFTFNAESAVEIKPVLSKDEFHFIIMSG